MSDEIEEHEGHIVIGEIVSPNAPADLKPPTVQFVHYPGAQQLQLWLPRPGYQGYDRLTVAHGKKIIEDEDVGRRLNGSIQILFRTLPWPEGEYRITITNKDGFKHEIELKKLPPGVEPPKPPPPPPEPPRSEPVVYRDGAGREIPNVDLEIRQKLNTDLKRRFGRNLTYEGTYRGGTIILNDGDRSLRFSHEMAGGDMKFWIDIPGDQAWEAAGFRAEERAEIIAWVAERVKQEQAPSWRYEITADTIDFY
ncbi:MAG TPA: hypothetical protein VG942_07850, partial [Hyphomonadaceae bacterium]|nr:hypothetical protein [Hyphomonadaceae bacterium]